MNVTKMARMARRAGIAAKRGTMPRRIRNAAIRANAANDTRMDHRFARACAAMRADART